MNQNNQLVMYSSSFSSWVVSFGNPDWDHTTNQVRQYGSKLHEEWC